VTLELALDTTAQTAFEQFGSWGELDGPDTPLTRFCALLAKHRVLDRVAVAVPGDRARAAQLMSLREAVPGAVNRRIGRAQQQVDARIEKTAADMIVPFERLEAMLDFYDREFQRRGLDGAVWGHISDGNLHPNVIPRSLADVESGKEAILAFGREAIRLGGAPLAEHGVGRNVTKRQLLAELYGIGGIEQMRRVKAAVDPAWKLAAGVLFSK
jgi:D-lactate dehydrogenase (cytochrome)